MTAQRILVADSAALTAQIIRAALDLLERPGIIIEARSGVDALLEIQRGGMDLLVSAAVLEDMRGFELASQANKFAPNLPVIILAGADDPEDDSEIPVGAPVYHLVRPADGDRFVRVLHAVMDGQEPSEMNATPVATALPDLGPVPAVNVGATSDIMHNLLTNVGAMAIILMDRSGAVLQEIGAVGYVDREHLAKTLVPMFGHMLTIGPVVGGKRPQAIHYYDGDEFDIFVLTIGLHHFLCMVFEGTTGARNFGVATTYGRRSAQEIVDLIGRPAFEFTAPAPAAKPKPRPTAERRPQAPAESSIPASERPTLPTRPAGLPVAPPPPAAKQPEPTPEPVLEPLPDDADLEGMLAGLKNLDMSKVDDLFDPDKLAEIAADTGGGNRLSYEEAQQMGVMNQ